jgi:uncharacterized membrane protein
MMPVSERIDWSVSRVPRRAAVTATVSQLYLVVAYLLTGLLPYLGRATPIVSSYYGLPDWLLFLPALLFGLVGFWVVAFDTALGAIVAFTGIVAWAASHRWISSRATSWLLAATGLSLALVIFSLTPLASDVRIWVLD